MNKVILLGNLGSDPELKVFENGQKKVRFTLATNESYLDKSGERKVQTEWHQIEVWDKQAEIAEKYLRKGRKVLVEGKLKTDRWKDQEGAEKSKTYIRCVSFELIDKPESTQSSSESYRTEASQLPSSQEVNSGYVGGSDDLPF